MKHHRLLIKAFVPLVSIILLIASITFLRAQSWFMGSVCLYLALAGFIYGIRYDGALQWYRHLGFNDGSATWTAGNGGLNVGTGWDDFTNVDIGGDGSQGLMYSWHADGTMRWYSHDGWWNGASTWKANSGRTIGGGWDMYAKVFSGDLLSVNL